MRGVQRTVAMDRDKFRKAIMSAVVANRLFTDRSLCQELRISQVTANRLTNFGRCSVDTFLLACKWAGLNPMDFVI